jgi:hypothetical protein
MNFIFEKINKNIEILYNNIEVDSNQKRVSEDAADHIRMLAPSEAKVKIKYRFLGGQYSGKCTVISRYGRFSAKAIDKNFENCVLTLKENLMARLNSWKQMRFLESAQEQSLYDRVG